MAVPLFDPMTPLEPLRDELASRAAHVLASGTYILGPELRAFETELADHLAARHVVGVANGTDALTLALLALGIRSGDDVVVPSFTFWASAESIPPTGARPVFCDVDPDTMTVTAETVRAALTPRTRAVIAVDLFGNPAPVPEIDALGVPVIEDAAQAAGARLADRAAASLGTIGTLSFYPSKNLGAFGDGGAVVTDDDDLADRVRVLRAHGSRDRATYERIGFNSRLDELQAALLRLLLPHLDGWAEGRGVAARHYEEAGLGDAVRLPRATPHAVPAWHLYVIRHEEADALGAALAESGVGARGYYRTPIHRQPAMADWVEGLSLPVTEELARTHLAIPMSPVLGADTARQVVAAVRRGLAT